MPRKKKLKQKNQKKGKKWANLHWFDGLTIHVSLVTDSIHIYLKNKITLGYHCGIRTMMQLATNAL